MQRVIVTTGVDLVKNISQLHSNGADAQVLVCRRHGRAEVIKFFSSLPPCLVRMEALRVGASLGP